MTEVEYFGCHASEIGRLTEFYQSLCVYSYTATRFRNGKNDQEESETAFTGKYQKPVICP